LRNEDFSTQLSSGKKKTARLCAKEFGGWHNTEEKACFVMPPTQACQIRWHQIELNQSYLFMQQLFFFGVYYIYVLGLTKVTSILEPRDSGDTDF
jgi:hypothetical protein